MYLAHLTKLSFLVVPLNKTWKFFVFSRFIFVFFIVVFDRSNVRRVPHEIHNCVSKQRFQNNSLYSRGFDHLSNRFYYHSFNFWMFFVPFYLILEFLFCPRLVVRFIHIKTLPKLDEFLIFKLEKGNHRLNFKFRGLDYTFVQPKNHIKEDLELFQWSFLWFLSIWFFSTRCVNIKSISKHFDLFDLKVKEFVFQFWYFDNKFVKMKIISKGRIKNGKSRVFWVIFWLDALKFLFTS